MPVSRPRPGAEAEERAALTVRIALVRKDYTRRKGGAEGYVVTLSTQLAAMGHEVHVFANRIDAEGVDGITFHEVRVPKIRTFLRHVWFAKRAEKKLREGDYDVINGLSRIWHQDVYRVGDPLYAHWLRSHPPNLIDRVFGPLNPKQRTMLSLEKKIFRSPMLRRIIAISRLDRELLGRYYDIPQEKIRVIYNGVRHDRFNPSNRRFRGEVLKGLGIDQAKTVLLFVGMDFKRKGLRHLIDALVQLGGELRHVHCLVVSDDNPRKYALQAQKSGVDVAMTFTRATPEVHRIYGAADIFVFPTLYDPFANVHLEALASGLPVITTSSAGGCEIVEEGRNGFVLPEAHDTERMAGHIRRLLDPVARREMSEAAVESVKDFTVERNSREVAELYGEVVREKRG
jgi:UDP-glucose:(heptosyl)LPS alpha-1,3-glucosyltransferase